MISRNLSQIGINPEFGYSCTDSMKPNRVTNVIQKVGMTESRQIRGREGNCHFVLQFCTQLRLQENDISVEQAHVVVVAERDLRNCRIICWKETGYMLLGYLERERERGRERE